MMGVNHPASANDQDEAGVLANDLARAYQRMAAFYREQLHMTAAEADQRASGQDYSPEEAQDDLARIRERPPDQVSWYDLERIVERDPDAMIAVWKEMKAAAREELASGHRAARALDWDGRPWQRARFLAIRASLGNDTASASGIEAALVDMAAEAYSVWLEESEHLHMQASSEVKLEWHDLDRHGGWSPSRLGMAEAMEQSSRMAERAHQRFLRTVKTLTELQRLSPSVYVGHAAQLNVGQQQVNVSASPTEPCADVEDLSK